MEMKSNPCDPLRSRNPLLTIITISFNVLDGFRTTSASLPDILPDWCEWVVVDGASTDGTLEAIEHESHRIARYISEPDGGIANAFNKAISLSCGRFVLFLNSGDSLADGFFDTIHPLIIGREAPPVIIGRIHMNGRAHGRQIRFIRQCMRNHLPHQAMLIRRSLFRLLGPFDESFTLGMDYEWSLRLKRLWNRIEFINEPLAEMEPGGASLTNFKETYRQYHRARMKNCDDKVLSIFAMWFFLHKHQVGLVMREAFRRNRGAC